MVTLNSSNTTANSVQEIEFEFNFNLISKLELEPSKPIYGSLSNHKFKAELIIPKYSKIIEQFYQPQLKYNIDYYHQDLNLPRIFTHFGICIVFEQATKIHIHDTKMKLLDSIKKLISKYGAVVLKNTYLKLEMRDMGHRNRFPQLNFHIDRNPKQETHYSVYTRNPFDDVQKHPRTSSTLFIPYLVAYLQGLKEGKGEIADKDGLIIRSVLYKPQNIPVLLNSIILPHSWNEPEGMGEISIIDNANVLHASYYPNELKKGYRIGVRYAS